MTTSYPATIFADATLLRKGYCKVAIIKEQAPAPQQLYYGQLHGTASTTLRLADPPLGSAQRSTATLPQLPKRLSSLLVSEQSKGSLSGGLAARARLTRTTEVTGVLGHVVPPKEMTKVTECDLLVRMGNHLVRGVNEELAKCRASLGLEA